MTEKFFKSDSVVEECLKLYRSLGKRGKPLEGREWTLLAGIVVEISDQFQAVAVATGTKCIGQGALSPYGDVVCDSHAEVLSRRAFLKYMYAQIGETYKNGRSFVFSHFDESSQKCCIRPDAKFHFYTSHVPCGDASIMPKSEGPPRKRKLEDVSVPSNKSQKTDDSGRTVTEDDTIGEIVDVHRTGAKVLDRDGSADTKLSGGDYHVVGVVRTKPGRGDPTLSVSCSDKMARWIYCGVQGALLSQLITAPILLDSVTVGGGGQYNEGSLCRALISRSRSQYRPELYRSDIVFEHSRYSAGSEAKPCPTSIVWSNTGDRKHEVSVGGKPQGLTKKNKNRCVLSVCKKELYRAFSSLRGPQNEILTYAEAKKVGTTYQLKSEEFKKVMGSWTVKPPLLEFTL